MQDMQPTADEILCAALDIGEHILKNGGEIHRVEDTIERICRAFSAVHVEVFAITSFIIASVRMPNGESHQQMRRLPHARTNLYMIEQMNALSRDLCAHRLSLGQVRERILEARRCRPYPLWLSFVFVILFGVGATLFVGGSLRDGLAAALAGIPVLLINRYAPRRTNPMVLTVFSSFVLGCCALSLVYLGLGESVGFVMAGAVMHLVPGLAFGNSLRDMMGGDTLAGVMRLFHTVLIALMLALGFAAAISIFSAELVVHTPPVAWYVLLASSPLFSLGYAVINDLPPRRLWHVGVGVLLTTGVYVLALPLGSFVSNLLACLVATVYCELLARPVRTPVISLLTPSTIALVPGALLYYTIHHYLVGDYAAAIGYANGTLTVCFGIAAGILLGTLIATTLLRLIAYLRRAHT